MRTLTLFFLAITIGGCSEINTSSPQASDKPSNSIRDSLFLASATMISRGSKDIIDSVWAEKTWRYEIFEDKKRKVRLNSNQVVVKLKSLPDGYAPRDYLLNWSIKEINRGELGTGKGVYILFHEDRQAPDTLHFLLDNKSTNKVEQLGSFTFIK